MGRIGFEKEVISDYLRGDTVKSISERYSINITTIYNSLHRNNIKPKTKKPINISKIIEDYLECNSIDFLVKKYRHSFETIKRILVLNGVNTDISYRKYNVNQNYFENIDSKDKAYFLGLLYADGYVNNEGFYLSLCEKDEQILSVFKDYLKYGGSIKTKKRTKETHCDQKQLNVFCSKISRDLTLLGCIQNKSHKTKYPTFLSDEFHSHFIRGVFDGDGSVYDRGYDGLVFSIIGNYDLIKGIQDVLIDNLDIPHRKLSKDNRCKNNIVSFKYSGKEHLLKIYNFLYEGSYDLLMERKYKKFKSFLDEKGLL